MKWAVWSFIAALSVSVEAFSQESFDLGFDEAKNFFVGGGPLLPNFGRVATSETGSAGLIGDVYGSVNASYLWWITPYVGLAPTLMVSLFGPDNPDGDSTHRYFGFSLPFLFPLLGVIDFRVGPGILFYRIYSDGGVVILDNGNDTAAFNLPQGATTSRYLVLDIGFAANLMQNVRIDLGTYVTSVLTTRRSFNMYMTASFGVF